MTPTAPTDRIQIAVDGPGPRFLGLTTAERNRRVAHRAEAHDPRLTGTLRLPDDIVLTPSIFEHLPPEGTWHIVWHPDRAPLAWQGEGTIGLPVPVAVPDGSALDVSTAAADRTVRRIPRNHARPDSALPNLTKMYRPVSAGVRVSMMCWMSSNSSIRAP